MQTYYAILNVLYLIFVAVICVFVVWNVIRTKKVTDKIIGSLALIMFVLRLFLIK